MTEEKDPQNCDELRAAIAATGENDHKRQQYLIKKSVELECVEHIPDDWSVDVNAGTSQGSTEGNSEGNR